MIIQLANQFVVHPKGVLEDILVQVRELVFPTDFYVLDMEEDKSNNTSDILLGQSFLSTARANIDVHDGTLSIEFDGEIVKFNVYKVMKYPDDVSSICGTDVIDPLVEDMFNSTCNRLTDFAGTMLEECAMLDALTDFIPRSY